MIEVWKDVKGYEGLYEVSSLARIKANAKSWYSGKRGGVLKSVPERILKPRGDRYNIVAVLKDGIRKTMLVHRAVAIAFIDNPNNLPEVNHINGNKKDNSIINLEWCTRSENCLHAHRTGLAKANEYAKQSHYGKENGNAKVIYQYNLRGEFIEEWGCAKEAADFLGFKAGNLCGCASGQQKSAYGFQWSYVQHKDMPDLMSQTHGISKKSVIQLNKEGDKVAEYESLSDAAKANSFKIANISSCLTGKGSTAYGYIWKYKNI